MIPYLLAVAGGYILGNAFKDDMPSFADGGMTDEKQKSKYLVKLLNLARKTLMNHTTNNGKLDYSDKEYGYLADEIEDVEVGYFDMNINSTYAEQLREEGFSLSKQDAIDILEHRLRSIYDELGIEMPLN